MHPSAGGTLADQRRAALDLAQRGGFVEVEEPILEQGDGSMLRKVMSELASGSVEAVVMELEDGTLVTLTRDDPKA